jgi:uncharacterized protein (DUF952 family)
MFIYKICQQAEWAQVENFYAGSAKDREDHFIHFSTAEQVLGTLTKYYANAGDLVLVAVDPASLGSALRYEASRDGALFPHLYGTLPLTAVRWVKPIKRNQDGGFVLPTECV